MSKLDDFYVPALVLHDSGVETVDGNSIIFKFPFKEYAAVLDVTAGSGSTPTLDVTIEEYDQASDTFFEIDAFTQATGVTFERVLLNADGLAPFGSLLRAVWDLGGTTPSFTFSLALHGKR